MDEDDFTTIDKNNINDILYSENKNAVNEPILINNYSEENTAEEGWDRKSKKQCTKISYLNPNTHLRYIDLNNSNKIVSLPNLKKWFKSD